MHVFVFLLKQQMLKQLISMYNELLG